MRRQTPLELEGRWRMPARFLVAPGLLAGRVSGRYHHRYLTVWLVEDKAFADHRLCVAALETVLRSMISQLELPYRTRNDG